MGNILFFLRLSEFLHDKSFLSCLTFQISFLSSLSSDPKDNKSLDESDEESYEPALNSLSPVHKERESEGILVEHHLSFFFYFYILEELYLMVHTLKSTPDGFIVWRSPENGFVKILKESEL